MAWVQAAVLRSNTSPGSSAVLWGLAVLRSNMGITPLLFYLHLSLEPPGYLPPQQEGFLLPLARDCAAPAEGWVSQWVAPCPLTLYHPIPSSATWQQVLGPKFSQCVLGPAGTPGDLSRHPYTIGLDCFHSNTKILFSFSLSLINV